MLECGGNEQQLLETKVQAFLKSRKNANSLVDIVSILEDKKDNFKKCIIALETIFVEVLTRKEMYDDKKGNRTSSEAKYRVWLRETYETTFSKLMSILEDGKSVSQQQAFDTAMKLLELEGKNPLEPSKYEGYQFPSHRLQQIVKVLLSSTRSMKIQIAKFSEFVQYQDIVYFTWKLLQSNTLVVSKPNETCISNFLDLVDKTIVKQDDSSLVLCSIDVGPEFSMQPEHVSKWIAKTWLYVMKWEHSAATHKQLMVVLLEKVLPHVKKPLYLTDYLMTTLGMGGALSVLALQGLLTLIQNYNLDYPNIYGKLYTMIDADIFHMKYKPRLFYLSDMFLTSSHLPQQLVAAFAKRLSRLTLIAPPQDIQIMLAFIGNLLIRHPGLKRLLVGSVTDPEVGKMMLAYTSTVFAACCLVRNFESTTVFSICFVGRVLCVSGRSLLIIATITAPFRLAIIVIACFGCGQNKLNLYNYCNLLLINMKSDKTVSDEKVAQFRVGTSPKVWDNNAYDLEMSSFVLLQPLEPIRVNPEDMQSGNRNCAASVLLSSDLYILPDIMEIPDLNEETPSFTTLKPMEPYFEQDAFSGHCNTFKVGMVPNGLAELFDAEISSFHRLKPLLASNDVNLFHEQNRPPVLAQEAPSQWENWMQLFRDSPTTSYLGKIEEEQKVYYQLESSKDPQKFNCEPAGAGFALSPIAGHHDVNSYTAPPRSWNNYHDSSPSNTANFNTQNRNFSYCQEPQPEYNGDAQNVGGNGYNPQYEQNYYQSEEQFCQNQSSSVNVPNAQWHSATNAPTKPAKPLNSDFEQNPSFLRYPASVGGPKRLYGVREPTSHLKAGNSSGGLGHSSNFKILSGKRSALGPGTSRPFYSSGLHRNVANAALVMGQARGLAVPNRFYEKKDADRGLSTVVNQIAPIQIRYKIPQVHQIPAGSCDAPKKAVLPTPKPRYFGMLANKNGDCSSNNTLNDRKTSPKFAPTAFELIEGSPVRKNAEASIELQAEASAALRTKASVEPRIKASIELRVETSIKPLIEASIQPLIEASIEPQVEALIEPQMEALIEPQTEAPADPSRIKVELFLDSDGTADDSPLVIHAKARVPAKSFFGFKKLKHRCLRCGAREATLRSLLTHVLSHRKPHCRQCCWIGDTLSQLNSHSAKAHSQVESAANKLNALVTSKYGRKRPVYSSKVLGPKTRRRASKADKEEAKKKKKKSNKKVPLVEVNEQKVDVKEEKEDPASPPRKNRSYFLRHSM